MRFLCKILLFSFCYLNVWSCLAASNEKIIPPVIVKSQRLNSATPSSAHKNIVTNQEIIDSGANTLTQTLQSTAGIQLHDTTGNGNQVLISMRGFGANASSNSLLLVNGIPLNNPDLMPPDLNTIPIQDIDHIEVISGSEAVLYGDQAVGGMINVITKKKFNESILLSCAGGSYNNHNCYLSAANHWRQLSYKLALLNQHTDNYRHHNSYNQNLLSGDLNYAYQQGNINFEYRVSQEHLLFPGALTASQVANDRRQANNHTDYFDNWNGFYHLQQQQRLSQSWYLETDMARREMHGNGVLFSSFDQSRVVHFIKPQLKGKIANVAVNGGIEFEYDDYFLKSLLGKTDDTTKKYAVFTLLNFPVSKRLDLSLGARAAQQQNNLTTRITQNTTNQATATTVGSSYQLNDKVKIYLRRAESFRFPKADENAAVVAGQAGLKTQTGVSYETTLEWLIGKSIATFSLYQLDLKNEIAFDPAQTPQHPFGTNKNLPHTRRQGFSVGEHYTLTEKLTLIGQYDYVYARFNSGPNNGKRIPLVAENMLHANINYAVTKCLKFYIEGVYTGNQFASNDDGNRGARLGGYAIYNANITYEFKQLSLALRVNNIFNKNYFLYSIFSISPPSEFFYPAARRNFLLTVKYSFV
ncbi:TonB-dependent receptor [soil metagenome]